MVIYQSIISRGNIRENEGNKNFRIGNIYFPESSVGLLPRTYWFYSCSVPK